MKNEFEIRGETVAIKLKRRDGNDLETVIDLADLPKAQSINGTWHAKQDKAAKTYYVCHNSTRNGEWVTLSLHRVIMEPPDGKEVDHRDHDGLNNRRDNVRNVTHSVNNTNGRQAPGASGIRSVYQRASSGTWYAIIRRHGRRIYLGNFATKEEAAQAVVDEKPAPKLTPKHGLRGVSWSETKQKWQAQTRQDGKTIYLGLFSTQEEATQAVLSKQKHLRGSGPPSKSGIRGVTWDNQAKKWAAHVRCKRLGRFATKELAAKAREDYLADASNIPTSTVNKRLRYSP